ncbi:hypothetical protein DL768_006490 [Monosporascus sp. mg162]|nr:hypothetical protein DL768_006490 [Monosporascus sp. mg162]
MRLPGNSSQLVFELPDAAALLAPHSIPFGRERSRSSFKIPDPLSGFALSSTDFKASRENVRRSITSSFQTLVRGRELELSSPSLMVESNTRFGRMSALMTYRRSKKKKQAEKRPEPSSVDSTKLVDFLGK